MSVVFVVSGGDEIRETATMLKNKGHDVVHDEDVDARADRTLGSGNYLVVAHGETDGTVTIARGSGPKIKWLWVDMPDPPSGVRVYIYSCYAGRKLVPALTECEAFGHVDRVPLASGDAEDCVSRFLAEAAKIVANESYDLAAWQRRLCEYLDAELQDASEDDARLMDCIHINFLRQSLNFGDPIWE